MVSYEPPRYPPIARRLGIEGVVKVRVVVGSGGEVLEVGLVSGIRQDVGINEAALDMARSARFEPATREGRPVRGEYVLTVPFRMAEAPRRP
jgi:protein TonB